MRIARASSELWRSTIVRFASVGILNTLLTIAIIFTLKKSFGMPDAAANFSGYSAGILLSFMLNRKWTFAHRADARIAFAKFLIVFAVAYTVNVTAVLLLIRIGVNSYLSHLCGMPIYTAIFYVGSRYFAFASQKPGVCSVGFEKTTTHYRVWLAATIAMVGAVLFYKLGGTPIAIWDEARLANNAIEMANSGLSLVTTYDGLIDHWNTKPPLMIWLMTLSLQTFGMNEWAIRLPSALAGSLTAGVIFWFCAAILRKPGIGFLSCIVLLATPGYVIVHGARSGDYDALLTLWTTSYVLLGYVFISSRLVSIKLMQSSLIVLVVLAFMTKTVQGLIFLPVLFCAAAFSGRLHLLLKSHSFYLSVVTALLFCAGYYVLREQFDPGYFAAVRANDLVGRYATVLENHRGGVFWYFLQVEMFPWLIPALISGTWMMIRGEVAHRKLSCYLLFQLLFYLCIISTASTKLPWYMNPMCPIQGLLTAMFIDDIYQKIAKRQFVSELARRYVTVGACFIAGATVVALNVVIVENRIKAKSMDDLDRYNVFLRVLGNDKKLPQNLVVVHPGYPNGQGDPFYIAPTLFYITALRTTGYDIRVQPPGTAISSDTEAIVVCGKALTQQSLSHAGRHVIQTNGPCSLLSSKSTTFGFRS